MSLVPKTRTILTFIFLIVVYGLLTMDYGLIYAQNAKLKVPADVTTQTLILDPQTSAPVSAEPEGQIYYNGNDTDNKPYYYNGLSWNSMSGGKDQAVATKIVAAWDSLDSVLDSDKVTDCPGNGTACYSPRADYTCDGTDDQDKINEAINVFPANGGIVYLLEGTYRISATPSAGESNKPGIIPHNYTAIIGTGPGTVLQAQAGVSYVFNVPYWGAAVTTKQILISQLMIDGNGVGAVGIYFSKVINSKIDKVWINNIGNGIYFNSCNNNTVSGNNIWNSSGGIGVGIGTGNIISGNNIRNFTGGGISLGALGVGWNGDNNIVSNNNISNDSALATKGYGIMVYPGNNNVISGNNIQNSNSGWGLIYIVSGNNNTISGNNIQGSETCYGIKINTSNNNISNNIIQNNAQEGIIGGGNSNIISGNIIYENGGAGNYDGIKIGGNNNLISSNRISDSSGTGFGINIASGVTNSYLFGNLIDGAGYTNRLINDSGTTTKYTDKTKMTMEQTAVLTIDNNSTITPSSPTSYQPVKGNGTVIADAAIPIAAGKAAGDILILQGDSSITTNTVTIPDSGNVNLGAATRPLDANDTLVLIWDGTYWVETGYSVN